MLSKKSIIALVLGGVVATSAVGGVIGYSIANSGNKEETTEKVKNNKVEEKKEVLVYDSLSTVDKEKGVLEANLETLGHSMYVSELQLDISGYADLYNKFINPDKEVYNFYSTDELSQYMDGTNAGFARENLSQYYQEEFDYFTMFWYNQDRIKEGVEPYSENGVSVMYVLANTDEDGRISRLALHADNYGTSQNGNLILETRSDASYILRSFIDPELNNGHSQGNYTVNIDYLDTVSNYLDYCEYHDGYSIMQYELVYTGLNPYYICGKTDQKNGFINYFSTEQYAEVVIGAEQETESPMECKAFQDFKREQLSKNSLHLFEDSRIVGQ